jgi:hypothetical protein
VSGSGRRTTQSPQETLKICGSKLPVETSDNSTAIRYNCFGRCGNVLGASASVGCAAWISAEFSVLELEHSLGVCAIFGWRAGVSAVLSLGGRI